MSQIQEDPEKQTIEQLLFRIHNGYESIVDNHVYKADEIQTSDEVLYLYVCNKCGSAKHRPIKSRFIFALCFKCRWVKSFWRREYDY